jgi:regulator of sirC expression with transglutaminase-like and TPR domain
VLGFKGVSVISLDWGISPTWRFAERYHRETQVIGMNFQEELHQKPLDVARVALCIAQDIAYPHLDLETYQKKLDNLTESARQAIPQNGSAVDRAISLTEFLFNEEGFQGNRADYLDPRNSYLNDVLDRRLGIPISLSILFLHIGQQLNLPVFGVGMPGHFIVSVQAGRTITYLDPFNGGFPLTLEECAALVSEATGYDGPFDQAWLRRTAPGDILIRVLNNLRGIFIHREEWARAVSVVEHLLELRPESPDSLRDLGLLHYRAGSLRKSVDLLSKYLKQYPSAEDATTTRRCLRHICKELATLN